MFHGRRMSPHASTIHVSRLRRLHQYSLHTLTPATVVYAHLIHTAVYTYPGTHRVYTYQDAYSSVHLLWYIQQCTPTLEHTVVYTCRALQSSVHLHRYIQWCAPTLVHTVVYTYPGTYSSVHLPCSVHPPRHLQ